MKIFVSSHFPRADFDRLQGAGLPKGRQNDLKMETVRLGQVSSTLTRLPWSVEEGMQDCDDNFAYPWS
ncbi:hypothetical protein NP493_331g02008 [Ridgeia piscesae]|uniref:Uncharacterized protein n=1 Tax=Ridgeia piscesae TaxID=27915 RepID=A0AAD9NVQ9_RIDPI|nr:hypothetical protein NP493_331g02008 [Ridgeia piscesae]